MRAGSEQRLRVALVTRSLMMGGAQRHVLKLCQTAPRDRVQLSLFLLSRDESQDLLPQLPPDVPVFISPHRRHHPLVLRWLAAGVAAQRAQVAHSFLWIPDAFAALSRAAGLGVPLICSERGDRGAAFYTAARRRFDQLVTFRVAARFCANSHFGAALLRRAGCPPEKVRVIHNGVELARIDAAPPVDLRAKLGWPENAIVAGAATRLIDYKGVDTLLYALASAQGAGPVYALIIGDGPQRGELEALAGRLGLDGRVAFLGTQSDAAGLIKGCDLALLATRADTEHCSNSILEYMACRLPVVATAVAGNPELVTDGVSGLLVAPDDARAMAAAISRLSADTSLRAAMGAAGRARVEREFLMDDVTSRFLSLWHEAAAGDHIAAHSIAG